jgi:hypothetical protein
MSRLYGIKVHRKKPSWSDDSHYHFLQQHSFECIKCEVDACLCPKGRNYDLDPRWEVMICDRCSSNGAHIPCFKKASGTNIVPEKWYCDVCTPR